jgi:hypothetical protein
MDASAASSDPATALMQTIQQALSQTGVQAPTSSGAVDAAAPTNGIHSASGTAGPSGPNTSQAGSDTDGDHDGSVGAAAGGGQQQTMFQFMHALMGAVNSAQSSGSASGTSGASMSSNPYSSIESGVQNLLSQLVNDSSSTGTTGSQITGSSSKNANPALEALSTAFQNLMDTSGASSTDSNTNVLGIPRGLPGTQPTLQAFLQNLESNLTKGSASTIPSLSTIGSLVSTNA